MEREATVVRLTEIREHPNADKVNLTTIFGNQIVIGKDYKEGDLGLFFEVDTQLSEDFCKWNNLYRDSLKNFDTDQSGYFEDNRRVRAQTFRGEKSEGFFVPLSYLNYLFIGKIEVPVTLEYLGITLGDSFKTLYGKEICRKYVGTSSQRNRPQSLKKRLMKDLAPHFKEHFDTGQYFRETETNKSLLDNGNIVYITEKLHGTSVRFGSSLVKIEKGFWYKLIYKIFSFIVGAGFKYRNIFDYRFVVGSRKVIKSIEDESISKGGFYEEDIWTEVSSKYKRKLYKGETIYGEIVGYLSNGAPIMGTYSNEKLKSYLDKTTYKDFVKTYGDTTQFSYGCTSRGVIPEKIGEHRFKLFVYRITMTSPDGKVYDLPWAKVQKRCQELGLECVPTLVGPIIINEEFEDSSRESLNNIVRTLTELPSRKFVEHIKEGICVRIENEKEECTILKNKSFIFKVLEGIRVEADTEDNQK